MVESVEAHDVTSSEDRLVSTQAAGPCFFVGEKMSFLESAVIPCPSSTLTLRMYPDFKGTFDYVYDSKAGTITFPEVTYMLVENEGVPGMEGINVTILYEMTYNLKRLDDSTLRLQGERNEYDKLGNLKRRYSAEVVLKR